MSVIPERRPGPESAQLHGGFELAVTPVLENALNQLDQFMALHGRVSAVRRPWKRTLDLVVSLPFLLLAIPVVASAALLVLIFDRHAPFYADTRVALYVWVDACRSVPSATDMLHPKTGGVNTFLVVNSGIGCPRVSLMRTEEATMGGLSRHLTRLIHGMAGIRWRI